MRIGFGSGSLQAAGQDARDDVQESALQDAPAQARKGAPSRKSAPPRKSVLHSAGHTALGIFRLGRHYGGWTIVSAHAGLAFCVTVMTWGHFVQRQSQVQDLAATAQREETELHVLQTLVGEQRALLEGLRVDDPYVIELLARERYNYEGADPRWQEIVPPPRTATTGVEATPTAAIPAGVAQW